MKQRRNWFSHLCVDHGSCLYAAVCYYLVKISTIHEHRSAIIDFTNTIIGSRLLRTNTNDGLEDNNNVCLFRDVSDWGLL